jgi:ABC-type dipeptide/oligopeptide/nickel transport system permease subunit
MSLPTLETVGGEGPSEDLAPEKAKKVAGKSPTRIALERLRSDKVALFSGGIVALLVLVAIFAPLINSAWGISQNAVSLGDLIDPLTGLPKPQYGPPEGSFVWSHPLGVNPRSGSDNLAFLLVGLRTDLAIALLATLTSTILGLVLGLSAGFIGGWTDRIIQFFTDAFLAFPFLLGALCLAPIITSKFATNPSGLQWASFLGLCAILVFFGWMGLTRLIRGQVFQLREREFVQAARVLGVPTRQILFRQLLPNLVAPIVVSVSLSLPAFVAAEAGLTFLGIGLQGVPSLGVQIQEAVQFYSTDPIFLYPPVIVLAILVLALNLLGDSVRDAFDPGTRR